MPVRKLDGTHYYIDFRFEGKRFRRRVPGNIRDKQQALAYEKVVKEEMVRRRLGVDPPPPQDLAELIRIYLEYSKNNKARSTYIRDERSLRIFTTVTGFTKLTEVTPLALESYKTKRLETVSKRTVNIEIKTLKAMLNRLIQLGVAQENPIKSVRPIPGADIQVNDFLDEAEIEAMMRAASPTMRPIIYTWLKTGMRRSELIYLEWTDIDFENQQIRVMNKEEHPTKFYKTRFIPIKDEKLISTLQALPQTDRYVFVTKAGTIRKNNLLREVKRIAQIAGIQKRVNIKLLRHTFASQLGKVGVPLKAISELLGHSSITTTMRYSHLARKDLEDAVKKLPF